MARVCVLGATVAKDLFGDESPLGRYLQVQKVRFRVKGVLQSKGTSPIGTDFDNRILIPLSTGLRRLLNQDYISYVRIKLDDADHIVPVAAQVRELIHSRHHITPPEEDDFRIVTPTIVASLARGASRTLSLLVTALAAISLLVGGIVLMNILLISVSGRAKEIGLRRAVGASRRDILFQFLTESLVVTFFGMLIGCGISIVVCTVLARETKIPVGLSWEPFALALVFALVVGTFFGVQPARRAAATNPVRALR